jgi:quinol-cytochrome oxidoreductase complex cytochrome b subunit
MILFASFSAFLALPFLDRSTRGSLGQRMVLTMGLLVIAAWLVLTIYGARVA